MTITKHARVSAVGLVPDRPDLPWAHDWEARAVCASRLDLPWLTDTAQVTGWQAAAMRAVCDTCPVVLDCLAAVDALDVSGGWWAGADRDPHTRTTPRLRPRRARPPRPVATWRQASLPLVLDLGA